MTFVETASPAWDGGIREGDVLLSINRETVRGLDEYRKAVSRLPRGRPAFALVYREGVRTCGAEKQVRRLSDSLPRRSRWEW